MPTSDPRARRWWVAPLLLAVAVALVPWTAVLGYRLPSQHTSHHWDAAWVGLDVAIAAALAATAYALLRRRPWVRTGAAVTATLLLTDAWFDNLLANGGREHLEAALEALLGELPLALVCLWLAWNASDTVAAVASVRGRFGARRGHGR